MRNSDFFLFGTTVDIFCNRLNGKGLNNSMLLHFSGCKGTKKMEFNGTSKRIIQIKSLRSGLVNNFKSL